MSNVSRIFFVAAFAAAFCGCSASPSPPARPSSLAQKSSSSAAPQSPNGWGGGLPVGSAASTFRANMSELATSNTAFRRVLFTGTHTQLVAMSLDVDEDIGVETHGFVEQIFFVVAGSAKVFLDGEVKDAVAGDVVIVRPGVRHDVRNVGLVPLKLLTIYSPPAHLRDRVQQTKAAAEADAEDKAFGDAVE